MEHIAWAKEIEEIQNLKISFDIENHNLLKEIESVVGAQDDVVTLLYSRRALEVIITELCVEKLCRERGTEPLNSLIDKLYKEKFLPEFIQTSMQNLNRISTFGAHPKEFDPRQVRTTLIELVTVLEWFFKERNYSKKEEKKVGRSEEQKVGRSEDRKVRSSEVQKISDSEEGKGEITEDVKHTLKEQKTKKKLPLVAFAISLLSVVFVAVIIFFIKQNALVKPSAKESKTIDLKAEKKNILDNKTVTQDSLAKAKTDEIIANTNLATTNKTSTQQTKPVIKKEEPIVKENKKTYTMQAPQPKKEEDIYSLFKQLSDTKKEFSERKNVSQQLLQLFDKQAFVTITIDNQVMERMLASDYINRMLTLKGWDIKIKNQERNPSSGKIKSIDVVEIRK